MINLPKEPVLGQFALEETGSGKLFGLGFQLPAPLGVVHRLQVDQEDGTAATVFVAFVGRGPIPAPFGHLPVDRACRVDLGGTFALLDGLRSRCA